MPTSGWRGRCSRGLTRKNRRPGATMKRLVAATVFAAAVCPTFAQTNPAAVASPALERAKALFERYVALEKAFDPSVADLYSDAAVITNTRTYPTGEVREITIPAPQYKQLIRAGMPLARQVNDTNRYSERAYRPTGHRVAITCKRLGERKRYTSPIRLVVG